GAASPRLLSLATIKCNTVEEWEGTACFADLPGMNLLFNPENENCPMISQYYRNNIALRDHDDSRLRAMDIGASDTGMRSDLYLNGYNVDEYLGHLRRGHPELYDLLSLERCRDAERYLAKMNEISREFEDEQAGGRGLAYNVAQRSVDNRKVGMTTLL